MPEYGEAKKVENSPPQSHVEMMQACRMANIALGGIEITPKEKNNGKNNIRTRPQRAKR